MRSMYTAGYQKTRPLPARGKLYGMRVVFAGKAPDRVEWTVLDRHPLPGHWWLHRRDDLGTWVTTFARYSDLEQVIMPALCDSLAVMYANPPRPHISAVPATLPKPCKRK